MFKKIAFLFVFIGFVTFWCAAQSTNYEPKIVGTWTDLVGETWVFNSDGTGQNRNRQPIKFAAIDGKLVIYESSRSGTGYEFVISPDGKTLILFISGSASDAFVLQKKT
ncbi:hypothetical protein AGMMS50293_28710 [Spirochaetia bacterium]|nr:hypothetical protein AGMMS50293_28710 [Spirochaetia bacterium]